MKQTWTPQEEITEPVIISPVGWLRAGLRAVPLLGLVFGGLAVLLALRMIERPLCGLRRPVTPFITQFVCRNAFRILGMGFTATGQQMQHPGAVVANHSSWLDIFSLNAAKRIYFVSKAEVARWPGIGWLARATGTVFIERNPRKAAEQKAQFEARLAAGHKLLFFPEGTSTDGQRVLPFKSTLFAAFFTEDMKPILWVQPVTVIYTAPPGQSPRYYGWWGDMDFAPHLLKTLAARRNGAVEVVYHPPLKVSEAESRKTLALACETAVRGGHPCSGRLQEGA